jgi:hypothetical protein
MMSAATLRRLALVALTVAIITGVGSLILLMMGRISTPLVVLVSTVFLLLGLALDRLAARHVSRSTPEE